MGNTFFDAPPDDFDPNAGHNPKPPLGRGTYVIKQYYEKDTKKKGKILAVDLLILSHPSAQPGMQVGLAWFVNESDAVKQRYERARARDFVLALLGLPAGSAYGPQAARLAQRDNPGAGLVIDIEAVQNGQWQNYTYHHNPDQSRRAQLRERIMAAAAQAQQTGLPPQANQPPPPVQFAQAPAQGQQFAPPQGYTPTSYQGFAPPPAGPPPQAPAWPGTSHNPAAPPQAGQWAQAPFPGFGGSGNNGGGDIPF